MAEGRDIGTVVAPDAEVKVFLTASPGGARAAARGGARHRRRDGAARPGAPRRAGHGPRALAAEAGARRGGARHERPEVDEVVARDRGARGTTRDETPGRRGRRLSERRQVHARQPALRTRARRWCTSRPGVTRDRKEIDADWNGVGFTLIDTGGVDFAGEHELAEEIRRQALDRARGRRSRGAGGRRARRAAPGRRRAGARAARRRRAGDRGGQQGRRRAPGRVSRPSSTGSGWATRCRSPPRRASAPATCSTGSWSACRRPGRAPRRASRGWR